MKANTRLKVGLAFAIGGNLLFFTSAWIAWMPWTASFKATLWGILFFAPETGTIICVAMIGKENYERFKNAFLAWWRRLRGKEPVVAAPVVMPVEEPKITTEDRPPGEA